MCITIWENEWTYNESYNEFAYNELAGAGNASVRGQTGSFFCLKLGFTQFLFWIFSFYLLTTRSLYRGEYI